MSTPGSVLVVGGSLAGLGVVRALRDAGFDGPITVVGDESEPYDRPPLSKGFLAGEVDDAGCSLIEPEDAALAATWELGRRATALHADGPAVDLDDGRRLVADAVVLCTGAHARTLPGRGGVSGVHVLRTLQDARALRADLVPGRRLVVVGGGFVGCEVAATAMGLGLAAALVERDSVPLGRALGAEMGTACTRLLQRDGLEVHAGVAVAGLVEEAGAVRGVALGNGTVVEADVVVVGVGCAPTVGWLADSGLALDDGVRTDALGRTSMPGVWAVGDCARTVDPVTGAPVRHEHWSHAAEQPAVLAAAMLGAPAPREAVPSFWSDQGERRLRFAGRRAGGEVVRIVDGDPASGRFVALYEPVGAPGPTAVLSVDDPRGHGRWRRRLVAPAPRSARAA